MLLLTLLLGYLAMYLFDSGVIDETGLAIFTVALFNQLGFSAGLSCLAHRSNHRHVDAR